MTLKTNDYNTRITSVSVSKEMQGLIEQFGFSPTEVYRRGVAVMLCDKGYAPYVTETNLKRNDYIKKYFSNINLEELKKALEDSLKAQKILLEQIGKLNIELKGG